MQKYLRSGLLQRFRTFDAFAFFITRKKFPQIA
jgi:hypothetical protein